MLSYFLLQTGRHTCAKHNLQLAYGKLLCGFTFGNPWICTRKAGRKSRVNAPLPRPEKERGNSRPKQKKLKSQKTTTRKFWQVARTLVRVDVCVNTKIFIAVEDSRGWISNPRAESITGDGEILLLIYWQKRFGG